MRPLHWRILAGVLSLFLATVVGCGGSPYELAPVAGIVTLNGRPLVDAQVSFQPRRSKGQINSGPASYGTTNEAGRFELLTLRGDRGAVVGQHDVTVSTYRAQPDRSTAEVGVLAEERVPSQYQMPGTLTATVPAGGLLDSRLELHVE